MNNPPMDPVEKIMDKMGFPEGQTSFNYEEVEAIVFEAIKVLPKKKVGYVLKWEIHNVPGYGRTTDYQKVEYEEGN